MLEKRCLSCNGELEEGDNEELVCLECGQTFDVDDLNE